MGFWKHVLWLGGGLLALAGCSGADLLNATIPRSGYSVHKDIAYGSRPRQMLDIYTPDAPEPGRGVILFFYGGSWQSGSKDAYRFAGQAFASKGFTTVIADYRLYPDVSFPTFIEDGAQALVWTHAHIAEYGGDPAHLFVAGHSAGAYIAAMLTLDGRYVAQAGASRGWIAGMIGLAGPYDFLPLTDKKLIALFSTAAEPPDTQPITYAGPGLPPMLLLTGDADTEVYPKNTINLAAKLRLYGDSVEDRIYSGVGHIGLVLSLARGFRGKAPALDDMADFIHAIEGGKAR